MPEMGRNLGRGIKEFKEGLSGKEAPEENRPEAVERAEEKTGTETTQEKKEAARTKGSE